MANQQATKDTEPKLEHIAGAVHESAAHVRQAASETVDAAADTAQRATGEVARAARDLTGAFANSYGVLADGIQELQHGYWRVVQSSFDLATSAPAEMMRCRSLTELSELQREIFTKYLDGVADANRTLIDVSARVAGQAVRPLQEQAAGRAH